MKKITLSIFLIFFAVMAFAQGGLECIYVEKYYVSTAADSVGSAENGGGNLPAGSVTYRIYLDMLPGYKFQLAFGNAAHPLTISTTTTFFNNEDRGDKTPSWSKTQAKANSVMLDSWVSAGGASTDAFGIIKSDDDGVANNVNQNGILQNADNTACWPLTQQDGFIVVPSVDPGSVTFLPGLNLSAIQGTSQVGSTVTTSSSGWSCLEGAVGPDSNTNMVLIAQLTTTGDLTYDLNIQIGTPDGETEVYVANGPVGADTTVLSCLSNAICTVGLNDDRTIVEQSVKMYPNPANDIISLEINTPNQSLDNSYVIYGVTGNEMAHKKLGVISGKYLENINMSSFASGVYILQLTTDGDTSYQKVVKN